MSEDYLKKLEEKIKNVNIRGLNHKGSSEAIFLITNYIIDDNKAMFVKDISGFLGHIIKKHGKEHSSNYNKITIRNFLVSQNDAFGKRYGIKVKSFGEAITELYDDYDKIRIAKGSRHGNLHENIMYKKDDNLIKFISEHSQLKKISVLELTY